jgi:hypothetical protein
MIRRYSLVLLLALSLLFPGRSVAQHIYGAISAGMNLTQVDGDEKYGYHKVGLNIGPSVIIPFGKTKKWSVTMELLYSQLGSRENSQYGVHDSIIDSTQYYDGYKLNLNYVQIPLMVHFTDKKIIAGGVGFLYGQLVGVSEYEDHNDSLGFKKITTTTLQGPYSLADFEVVADVRLRIWQRLWFNFRYSYSIIPIRRNRPFENYYTGYTWTRNQYNNVLTFRLTYIFNEPITPKLKKTSPGQKSGKK